MKRALFSIAVLCALYCSYCNESSAGVVINEFMYHAPASNLEYIELFNDGTSAVDISGWMLKDDQDDNIYRISNGSTIPPNGFFVIADDAALFRQIYGSDPNADGLDFNLSDGGDAVRLFDAAEILIEGVAYDDRPPWSEQADGNGSSLERLNPRYPAAVPVSWAASQGNGTPGAVNSVYTANVEPVISSIEHFPKIPAPGNQITVVASVLQTANPIASVNLRYGWNNGSTYQSVQMNDDGQSGDGEAGDGVYGVAISGGSDEDVFRFYVEASDTESVTSAYPAEGGDLPYLAVVENPIGAESVPVFRIVMRPEVRQQFLQQYQTDNYFPASFYDGDDTYYRIEIRHRGRSRIQNGRFKIEFPHNDLYQDKIRRLNFNGTDSATILKEYVSFQLFGAAGLPNLDTWLVRFHINGETASGSAYRIAIENPDAQFLNRMDFFDDDDGNLYKTTLDGTPDNKATLRYAGTDPDLYRNCYLKQTNEEEDDYTDIIRLCKTLAEARYWHDDYEDRVNSVLDVDEFLRWMAVAALVAHWDSPITDHGHNYVLHSDSVTKRFSFITWDMNGTFRYSTNENDINYRKEYTHVRSTKFDAINQIFNHPKFGAQFYGEIDRLMNTLFTTAAMQQRIEDARSAIRASNNSISFMNSYVLLRRRDMTDWINRNQGAAFFTNPAYQANLNEPYVYHASAGSYRSDGLPVYELTEAPAWLSIDPQKGTVSGTPPQEGRFDVTVTARFGTGKSIEQSYSLQVTSSQPRLIMNFNEDDGAAQDLSAFSNDGVVQGGARRVAGRLGSGIELSSQRRVTIDHDDSLNLTGSITVEAWIRPNISGSGNPVILTKGGSDQFNYTLMLGYGPFNWDAAEPCFMPHRFDIENRVYYGRKEIEARIPRNQWAHIAGTYDSCKQLVIVYYNNYPIVYSASRAKMDENTQDLLIGLNSNQSFPGVVDDIRILPFAKTAFAAGLCISQVDVSGISTAQDRVSLSLYDFRRDAVDTAGLALYRPMFDEWIPLPPSQLEPGATVTWWLDDLGVARPLQKGEQLVLYPADSAGNPSNLTVLDQVAWGGFAPGNTDPGVQAALWLPGQSVLLPGFPSVTLALDNFADNDDMELDWGATEQNLDTARISINNNAAQTNNRTVNVQITASGNPTEVRFSNDGAEWSNWSAFNNTTQWQLANGDGEKTVYAQTRNNQNNRSAIATATINLQTGTAVKDWKILNR